MTTPPDDTTTDLHAVIVALRAERDAALSEKAALAEALATRNSEFGERIEYQAATLDVLKAMSASPGDPQPVFDLIVERARDLCDAYGVTVLEFDGGLLHYRAANGVSDDAETREAFAAMYPRPPTRDMPQGRAILDRRTIRIDDLEADQSLNPFYRGITSKSTVVVPLMRGEVAIGTVGIGSRERGGFSGSQIELLQTFAEQAVIAITSAETYRALQARTNDLQETLEYQTATGDVLKVISGSSFALEPVFQTVVEIAMRLCRADQATIFRLREGAFRWAAGTALLPEYERRMRSAAIRPGMDTLIGRVALRGRPVQIVDEWADPLYRPKDDARVGGVHTSLGVPLLRDGVTIGAIGLGRLRVEPFTERQIELVKTFADQAVIAIENTRLLTEQRDALEQQTATVDVLRVINWSPGDLVPVFNAILEWAHRVCDADGGVLYTYDGTHVRVAAVHGYLSDHAAAMLARAPYPPPNMLVQQMIATGRFIQVEDVQAARERLAASHAQDLAVSDMRTVAAIPLLKDGSLIGYITAWRRDVRLFSDKQIGLLENFAAQAVIAMENARLLNEQREALEQQTAMAEVLQVINASPGDLMPVFDAILEKAMRLCGAAIGGIYGYDGQWFHPVALRGVTPAFAAFSAEHPVPSWPSSAPMRILRTKRPAQVPDLADGSDYTRGMVELGGIRALLDVPLLKEDALLGFIAIYREEAGIFSDKQVALLENFAAQAVIAMDNARLLNEIRQRQAELRVTFDNMGDGVVMFDAEHRLAAWNRNFQQLLDIPNTMLIERPGYADYLRLLARRGEFGTDDVEAELARRLEDTDRELRLERTRPDGRVIEVRRNAVPGGGFVLIYADITERKRNEAEIRAARDAAEAALLDLKAAQANLVQAEKMASLGQLTAGIAHEIKNPLNFVNNFADLSVELLNEMKETVAPALPLLDADKRGEIGEAVAMVTANLKKISEHGRRADGIVKAMLEHSRGSSGERRVVDLNALIDDALNLAYHGARAQDQSFNITLERDFAEGMAPIELAPQDMTRVLLNLFSNGFYAATRRARGGADVGFMPTLKVTTRDAGEAVEVRVRDNGTGIPADIRDKLFQPFFTTKPTGEGTGLGLSITYDIVTQQHGGSIALDSKVGKYSEFTMRLPRNP